MGAGGGGGGTNLVKTVPRNWHRSVPGQWAGTDRAGSGQPPMFSGARGWGIPPEARFWTKHCPLHYRGKSSLHLLWDMFTFRCLGT